MSVKLKKILFTIFSIGVLIFLLFNFFSKGIIVKYERSSGPELVLLSGKTGVKNKSARYGVNYFESAYSTYNFDTQYGFKNIGISFAFYEVVGSRLTEDALNQKVAVLEVKQFYSIFLVVSILLLVLLIYGYIIYKLRIRMFG